MAGKCLEDWTFNDIRDLVNAVRLANVPRFDDLLADEILERFKDMKLIDAHQRFVVWNRRSSRKHKS